MTDTPEVRTAKSELRRWCDHQKVHFDPENQGFCEACYCGCDECDSKGTGRVHNTRLRRMLVCSVPDCAQAYFTRKDFDSHECGDAY